MRDYWEQNFPQIRIETVPPYGISVFNRCAAEGAVMVSTPFWTDVHPSLMTVPYEKGGDFTVPYGLVFAKHPAPHVAQFVQFMREAVAQFSASS